MTTDLNHLRTFVKVAELGSFTRAADQLGIAKAQASLHVQALEAELGARLLQRTTRTVRMTADGEQLLPRAKRLVLEADDVGSMFQGSRALRGMVRVDAPITLTRDVLIPRLPEFLAAHPHLELQLSATDRRVDVVREGFDVVLSIGKLRASGLLAQRLGDMSIVNCASAAYVKRFGMPRTLDDLVSQGHVVVDYALDFGAEAPSFEYADGKGGYASVPMKSLITVNNTDAYRAACVAGLGITQTPRIGVRALIEDGVLVEVLPELVAEPMPVWLVHSHGRNPPKRVRAVMQWIASLITPRLS